MQKLWHLEGNEEFPPSSEALDEPNGLLAFGGDLSAERLLSAYRRGIFPWYAEPQPILWWTPDPRCVLFPDEMHLSRSLRKSLRASGFKLAVNSRFDDVMGCCASPRADGLGTWIDQDMIRAYGSLHAMGLAHSVEVLDEQDTLVGGLYGVALGQAFFGESMFSRQTDASKIALVGLIHIMRRGNFQIIDCQVENEHLKSLGARCISRLDFERRLAQTIEAQTHTDIWHLPATCRELL